MTQQSGFVKTASIMIIFSLTILILIAGKQFLIPLILAILLSFLLLPISTYLEKKGLHKGIAIVVSILIAFVVIGAVVYFLYYQVMNFADDGPLLKQKLNEKILDIQKYVSSHYKVSKGEQNQWMKQQTDSLMNSSGQYLSGIFAFTGNFLASISLLPIYIFFLTMYKEKIKMFLFKVTPSVQNEHVLDVARRTAKVSQKYIRGLLIDISILAVLNSVGFLILGINYAILLGILAAILNLVPYIGVLIGSIFPFLVALLTKDSTAVALGAIGVCVFVQFLDNNFITPKVVGSSVSINPLATLIAIILGGILWGVAGMMLFIPLLGMLKVVLDSFPASQPFGFLIGEEEKMKPLVNFTNFKNIILSKK